MGQGQGIGQGLGLGFGSDVDLVATEERVAHRAQHVDRARTEEHAPRARLRRRLRGAAGRPRERLTSQVDARAPEGLAVAQPRVPQRGRLVRSGLGLGLGLGFGLGFG